MEPEPDFLLWCDQRDAAALGRVFDATGGKLLLLATHLSGSGAAAHDLVQATFLAAMRGHASWDRRRPLWPWLVGILQNEVAMQHRRGARRREVGLESADDAAAEGQDPQHFAASQEVLDAVLHAIDALPLPYRQVLRLRLVHGLRPVEIARSLEVPVGTVRAQLHRGLEQLRERLPVGIAGVLATLLLGDEALLAQVRQQVLEVATAPTSASRHNSDPAGARWRRPSWVTATLAGAGLALLATLGFATLLEVHEQPQPNEERAQLEHVSSTIDAPPTGTAPTPALERQPVIVTEPRWPLVVTVRTPDGSAIPGASVEVWLAPSCLQIWNQVDGSFQREDIAVGATDATGTFRTTLDALQDRSELFRRANQLWVRATWPHCEADSAVLAMPSVRNAQPLVAELQLSRRTVIVGTVTTEGGGPVCFADVMLVSSEGQLSRASSTDAHGAFCLEADPERWPASVAIHEPRAGSLTHAIPASVEGSDPRIDLGNLVLAARHSVRGSLVLGDGSTLAHAPVLLTAIEPIDPASARDPQRLRAALGTAFARQQQRTHGPAGLVVQQMQGKTAADGSFQFAGFAPDAAYAVSLPFDFGRIDPVLARADGEPVRLRIEAQLLTIEPRTAHGELVPGIRLLAEGYDPANRTPVRQHRPGFPETGMVISNMPFFASPDGRLSLLSPFGWTWRIGSSDEAAVATFLRHEVHTGVYRATRTLELQAETAFGKLHLVVVDEDGNPLPHGATMKAVDRDLEHNQSRMVPPAGGMTWELPAGTWDLHVLLGKEALFADEVPAYSRGFQQRRVLIETDRTTEVRISAPPAGQVAFQLRAQQPPQAWQNLRIETAGKPIEWVALDRDQYGPRDATPGGLPKLFVAKQALPVGKHRFVVEADGFQPAICEVDVAADRLNKIRVEMHPR